jgi:ABC-2 type transport system ATP-binding protein
MSTAEATVAARPGPQAVPDAAVSVSGLRKRYGANEVVCGIDLTVATGEVFAFLGPNGAGKSTTVEILEGYRRRDAGHVTVLGEDPAHPTLAWRARIGVVLQASRMPAELTVLELVERYAGFYPHPRNVDETIELVGLVGKRRARTGTLSGGQLRRLDVALAIVGDPDLIFLDEPTTGFDPAARHQAWELVAGLRHLGKTVLLTTHYMDEAEALADRVAVIVAGQIVAEGTPESLGGRDTAAVEISFEQLPEMDLHLPSSAILRSDGRRVTIDTTDPLATVGTLVDWSRANHRDVPGLEVRPPSLEEIYLRLTGAGA